MSYPDLISIIIPVFNETSGVLSLIEKTISLSINKEVIIIDDGSTNPQTRKIFQIIKNKHREVIIIRNKKNLGKSQSVQAVIKIARGNLITILDGDSELDPADIKNLYSALKKNNARLANGVRVVKGIEKVYSYANFMTRLAKKIVSFLTYFFYGAKVKDVLSGLKLFYNEDFKNHHFQTKRFGLETELIVTTLQKQRKIVEVDVKYFPRTYKEGKKINFFDSPEILFFTIKSLTKVSLNIRTPFIIVSMALLLWLLTITVYTIHANSSPTTDSIPNNFTAVNLIYHHRLDLENFRPYFAYKKITRFVGLENKNGVFIGKTPIINGILTAPVFIFFDKVNHITNVSTKDFFLKDYETYYQAMGKYYASFVTSFSVAIIFLTLYRLFTNYRQAIFWSLAYGFGTMAYGTAAQGNWQHGTSLLLINLSFFLFLYYLKNKSQITLSAISAILALATLIRISNLLFFISIIVGLFIDKKSRREITLTVFLFLLIFIFWNLLMLLFRVPGGYNDEIIQSIRSFNILSSAKAGASLLFSPNVGLFIFSPIFIICFLGIGRYFFDFLIDKRADRLMMIFFFTSFICFLLILFFNSFWWAWEAGYSWGPRLLTEGLPFLIYFGAYFVFSIKNKLTSTVVWLVSFFLMIYSIGVQIIGVYAYDTGWQSRYYKPNQRLEMAWYSNPNIIDYYLFKRKIFFTVEISKKPDGLKIIKKYYLIDLKKRQCQTVRTDITTL